MRQAELPRSVLKRLPCCNVLSMAMLGVSLFPASPAWAEQKQPSNQRWETGAYSFSAELGGFSIQSVSGIGTKDDPIVIVEELDSASPVTMTIRTIKPIRPFDYSGLYANGTIYLRLEVTNNSKLPWIEFELELQEHLDRPSNFGDGLSFDQRRTDGVNISSPTFLEYSKDFEPYDRLLFRKGTVDDRQVASFRFLITDYTPRWELFLVQDPRIPSS